MAEQTKKPSFSAAFPGAADIIGDFRKAFGAESVRHTYVEEAGQVIGKPLDESGYIVITGSDLIVAVPQKGEKRDR